MAKVAQVALSTTRTHRDQSLELGHPSHMAKVAQVALSTRKRRDQFLLIVVLLPILNIMNIWYNTEAS